MLPEPPCQARPTGKQGTYRGALRSRKPRGSLGSVGSLGTENGQPEDRCPFPARGASSSHQTLSALLVLWAVSSPGPLAPFVPATASPHHQCGKGCPQGSQGGQHGAHPGSYLLNPKARAKWMGSLSSAGIRLHPQAGYLCPTSPSGVTGMPHPSHPGEACGRDAEGTAFTGSLPVPPEGLPGHHLPSCPREGGRAQTKLIMVIRTVPEPKTLAHDIPRPSESQAAYVHFCPSFKGSVVSGER